MQYTVTNAFTGYAYATNRTKAQTVKLVAKLRKSDDCMRCGIKIADSEGNEYVEQYGELYCTRRAVVLPACCLRAVS